MPAMKQMRKIAIVQTAVGSLPGAKELAGLIIGKRLGACVQIARIKSAYRWQGKVESAGEFLLSIKTTLSSASKAAGFIKKHHPYQLPEIIIMSAAASREYAGWVRKETGSATSHRMQVKRL